jgi:hypothetical protein
MDRPRALVRHARPRDVRPRAGRSSRRRGLGRRRGRGDGRGGVRPGDDDCPGPRVPTRADGCGHAPGADLRARALQRLRPSRAGRRLFRRHAGGSPRRRARADRVDVGDRRVRPHPRAVDGPATGRRRLVGEDGAVRRDTADGGLEVANDLRARSAERAPAGGLADPRRARPRQRVRPRRPRPVPRGAHRWRSTRGARQS